MRGLVNCPHRKSLVYIHQHMSSYKTTQSRRKLLHWPLFIWSGRRMKLLMRLDWGHTTQSGSTEKHCSSISHLFSRLCVHLLTSFVKSKSVFLPHWLHQRLQRWDLWCRPGSYLQVGTVTGRRERELCEDEGTNMWSSRWGKWIWKLILYYKRIKYFRPCLLQLLFFPADGRILPSGCCLFKASSFLVSELCKLSKQSSPIQRDLLVQPVYQLCNDGIIKTNFIISSMRESTLPEKSITLTEYR